MPYWTGCANTAAGTCQRIRLRLAEEAGALRHRKPPLDLETAPHVGHFRRPKWDIFNRHRHQLTRKGCDVG